jgi:hypothetical protein
VVAYQQHCREYDASQPNETGLAEETLRSIPLIEQV